MLQTGPIDEDAEYDVHIANRRDRLQKESEKTDSAQESVIERNLNSLRTRLEVLDSVVRNLEEFLTMVLGPERCATDSAANDDAADTSNQSPLAHQLENVNDSLGYQIRRLDRLINRLEI